MPKQPKYKRVLLKLSGEILMGSEKFGIDYATCHRVASLIDSLCKLNIELGIVIGGGNIFRGVRGVSFGMGRIFSDEIGMLGTVINGKALQAMLKQCFGYQARLMSAIPCGEIVEPYNWFEALHHIEKGMPVIFVGGTGNPYFTTDTAAALRASELQAQILLKATKVDGVYDKDPTLYQDAHRFEELTFSDVLQKDLHVMDATAIALCRDNNIPIRVFDIFSKAGITPAVYEEKFGTIIREHL